MALLEHLEIIPYRIIGTDTQAKDGRTKPQLGTTRLSFIRGWVPEMFATWILRQGWCLDLSFGFGS